MLRWRRVFVPLVVLICSGCGRNRPPAETGPAATPDPAMTVLAAPPEVIEWTIAVPISGSLKSQSVVEVKSEVGGRLSTHGFEEGSAVRKGDLLAEVDTSNYRLAHDQAVASLAVAQAGVARTQVSLDHARREKDRADSLLRSGGITQKDHEAAATAVKEAESQLELGRAQVAQAQAAVAIAEKALRDCRIYAPAGGQVQKKYLDSGSLTAPGAPLFTIVDNSRLELECLLPSYRLADVRPGLAVVFSTPTWGDRKFQGVVSGINPVVEADNRSVRVSVRIGNPKMELKSGMFARGEIIQGSRKGAVVIPRSALIAERESQGSGSVFVVEGGVAKRRTVVIGAAREDRVWVREGLSPNEPVISEVGPSLKEGLPVRIVENQSPKG